MIVLLSLAHIITIALNKDINFSHTVMIFVNFNKTCKHHITYRLKLNSLIYILMFAFFQTQPTLNSHHHQLVSVA